MLQDRRGNASVEQSIHTEAMSVQAHELDAYLHQLTEIAIDCEFHLLIAPICDREMLLLDGACL